QVHYFDLTNQIYVETFFWDAFRFGLGFEHKYTQMKTETIADPEDSEDPNPKTILEKSHTFGPYGYLEYDSYDNTYFPDNGFYFRGDFHFYAFGAGATFGLSRFSTVKGKI